MSHTDDFFLWCSIMQLLLLARQYQQQKTLSDRHVRTLNELSDTWSTLIQCWKTLNSREDSDARHAANLIRELYKKYPPKGKQ